MWQTQERTRTRVSVSLFGRLWYRAAIDKALGERSALPNYFRTSQYLCWTTLRSLPGRSLSHGSFCYPFAQQHRPSARLLKVHQRPGRALTPDLTLLLRGKRWSTSYPTPWPLWRSLPVAPVSCTQGPRFNPSERKRSHSCWSIIHDPGCRVFIFDGPPCSECPV